MNLQREQREQIEATYAPLLAGVERLKEEGSELKTTGLVNLSMQNAALCSGGEDSFGGKVATGSGPVGHSRWYDVQISIHWLPLARDPFSGAGRNPKPRADGNCRASSISQGRPPYALRVAFGSAEPMSQNIKLCRKRSEFSAVALSCSTTNSAGPPMILQSLRQSSTSCSGIMGNSRRILHVCPRPLETWSVFMWDLGFGDLRQTAVCAGGCRKLRKKMVLLPCASMKRRVSRW